jgi:hypothetical protein
MGTNTDNMISKIAKARAWTTATNQLTNEWLEFRRAIAEQWREPYNEETKEYLESQILECNKKIKEILGL